MRVLHATRDFPPRLVGGVSAAVGALVRATAARGVEHWVLSFDRWRPSSGEAAARTTRETTPSAEVLRLEDGLDRAAVDAFVAAARPDVIALHDGALAPLVARAAAPRAPRLQIVHVLSHRQDALRLAPPTASTALLDEAVRDADRVVVATAAARAEALARWPEVAPRLRLAGLAATLPTRPRAADANRGPIVAALRFDWLKGADLLVAALPELARLRPVIVAGGLPESPKSERRWARKLEAAGATLAGWLAPDALADLLARAALFLAPSRLETCGLALLEARAALVPCVASDIESHREVAPDATFFASGDPDALVRAAAHALGSTAIEAARTTSCPTWETRAASWLDLWDEALREARPEAHRPMP